MLFSLALSSTFSVLISIGLFLLPLALFYLFYPALIALKYTSPVYDVETLQGEEDQSVALSIVIPAFNEEDRLPRMLKAAHDYFDSINMAKLLGNGTLEWMVVSDGSTDRTEAVYREMCAKYKAKPYIYKYVSLKVNSGKGAAVQAGMLHTKGRRRLMVDADGATEFGKGLEALLVEMVPPIELVWGSRSLVENRNVIRQALMQGFHFCTVVLVNADQIQDTQCGFKLFSSGTADVLFRTMHLRRWAFDTELVYLAKRLQYTIREVPVSWHEVEGSKLHTSAFNLAVVALGMLRDMICVRLCYTLGLWKVRRKND